MTIQHESLLPWCKFSRMRLVEMISLWQQEALAIGPPLGSDRSPALGGLSGPAFFPEGLGLSSLPPSEGPLPAIMAIGNNFGSAEYRRDIDHAGREDDKTTWRNLDALLSEAGANPAQCFRTNWFIGLLPGNRQTGSFLLQADPAYEEACRALLLKEIRGLHPSTLLFLGLDVCRRAHQIIPALIPWRAAKGWIDIDQSSIGHSVHDVDVPTADLRTNAVALLHPSFVKSNESRRMKNMPVPATQVQIVRSVLGSFGRHVCVNA